MKTKSLLLTALAVLLITSINAQEFKFGGQTGFVLSHKLVTDTGNDNEMLEKVNSWYDPMPSFGINTYLGYRSSSFWGVSILPGYVQKGFSSEYTYEGGTEKVRLQLHYINLPVLFDFYFFNKFCFSVGPEFAYMANANTNRKKQEGDLDLYDRYEEKFEMAIQLGLAYDVWGGIAVGVNYCHGLTPTETVDYTDNNGDPLGEYKFYNQYGQLFVRYKF